MQFFATVLALAAVAIAAPTEVVEPRAMPAGSCNAPNQKPVCCNNQAGGTSGILAGILSGACSVQVLGSNCQAKAYCCENGASNGGLINVNALNCVSVIS
ncbi:hypothetical protein CP533_0126 [Ophiocordyceps camponoti-saundersi (nom. inval.)]|nr:hypothetical protein CP533_0126 [Ophiocordyceps camponoti-saundersi (nom. inval.)]